MKKKSLSRILALGLTAVMTAGMLVGCGGDGGSESTEASGGGIRGVFRGRVFRGRVFC